MSAGHSGSTLLNMLLNGHDDVIGLSEVDKIDRYIDGKFDDNSKLKSTFWKNTRS
jgi:hypothetical protein